MLAAMVESGRSLRELRTGMHKLPQATANVETKNPRQAAANASLGSVAHDIEAALGDRGRVVIRPSGTEPVLRIMVEGEGANQVRDYADELAAAARHANGI